MIKKKIIRLKARPRHPDDISGWRAEIKDRDFLAERITACAYKVHIELSPGFIESIYYLLGD